MITIVAYTSPLDRKILTFTLKTTAATNKKKNIRDVIFWILFSKNYERTVLSRIFPETRGT